MGTRTVESNATGETFIFDDAGTAADGKVVWLRYAMAPGAAVPEHLHPGHGQSFEVVSGVLNVAFEAGNKVLKPGDKVIVPRGGWHRQWNEGNEPAVMIEGYDPPLDIEPFFSNFPVAMGETMFQRRPKSFGALLRLAVFMNDFSAVSRPRSALLFNTLAALAFVGRSGGLAKWYSR